MAALPIPPATPTRANNKAVDALRARCRVCRLSGKPELGLHIVYQHPPASSFTYLQPDHHHDHDAHTHKPWTKRTWAWTSTEPSMDEDDHRDLHSDVDAPHMVGLDGRTVPWSLAVVAIVCAGVVQPSWPSDHVVYKGQLHLDSSSGKKKCHHRSETHARGRDSITAF